MRTTIQSISVKLFVLFAFVCSSFYSLAQDSGATQTNSTASHSESSTATTDAVMWYSNPIVWVIGGVVLLLIIILAARSGKSNVSNTEVSRTTTTKTTVKED